jgi:hypothetical protein
MTDFKALVLGKIGKGSTSNPFKKKKTKKGKWGSQSLAHLKRRTTTKKKIQAKLRKYKYKGVAHKRIK